uniref:hypothetical protein n=1 Tax=Ornithinimicrobium sp. CNJ-824 TaxID=1904966 RepID=UPI0022A9CA69|nr:hypothetical protein [Ornithinimicrobium sp. CNJ-824]
MSTRQVRSSSVCGTSWTGTPWRRAETAYIPKVGGATTIPSPPGRHSVRTSSSMTSSLPRPTTTRSGVVAHRSANASTSAGGWGSG